jgi:four helix bundle protein
MANIVLPKSKAFAVRVVRLYQYLADKKNEYVLSKQLLRCGTSIGANVREASQAQSKKDFIAKMSIALKEASETEYWLELLFETGYITEQEFSSIMGDCKEINKVLTAIVKTSRASIEK